MERESGPQAKFDVFDKAVGNIPKPLTKEEKWERDVGDALAYRKYLISEILKRKSF